MTGRVEAQLPHGHPILNFLGTVGICCELEQAPTGIPSVALRGNNGPGKRYRGFFRSPLGVPLASEEGPRLGATRRGGYSLAVRFASGAAIGGRLGSDARLV